ncbi:hypothetical protein E4T56_gene6761 [Termitomyces sp. T112]|nr:hypothetical protein E4T56_gene6761 [Termitomyces sp. T112]
MNTISIIKFVVTSLPFTSLWGHDAQRDSWAGFPEEKQELFTTFHSVPNVILLSDDRHEFAAIEFTSSYPVWEFSTSPLRIDLRKRPKDRQIYRRHTSRACHQLHSDGKPLNGPRLKC